MYVLHQYFLFSSTSSSVLYLFIFLLKYDSWTQVYFCYYYCQDCQIAYCNKAYNIVVDLATIFTWYSIKKFSGLKSSHPPKARSPAEPPGKSAAAKKKKNIKNDLNTHLLYWYV